MLRKSIQALLVLALASFSQTGLAAIITYTAVLTGAQEVQPNASTATGSSTLVVDTDAHTLQIDLSFDGLTGGDAAAAHIHCCAAPGDAVGVAVGLDPFPAASSGAFSATFDLTDIAIYGGFFLGNAGGTAAGAEAALLAGLNGGFAYVNIHNATFPGGEIRGQFDPPAAVSSPASVLLLGLGLLALCLPRYSPPLTRPSQAA